MWSQWVCTIIGTNIHGNSIEILAHLGELRKWRSSGGTICTIDLHEARNTFLASFTRNAEYPDIPPGCDWIPLHWNPVLFLCYLPRCCHWGNGWWVVPRVHGYCGCLPQYPPPQNPVPLEVCHLGWHASRRTVEDQNPHCRLEFVLVSDSIQLVSGKCIIIYHGSIRWGHEILYAYMRISSFSDLTCCWQASWLDNSPCLMGHPSLAKI